MGDLNEYGEGQRDLAASLLKQLRSPKCCQYTLNDIKSSTAEGKDVLALLLITNELKAIREENRSNSLQNLVRTIKRRAAQKAINQQG